MHAPLATGLEARGEPDEGKIAVAHVGMNRASLPRFYIALYFCKKG